MTKDKKEKSELLKKFEKEMQGHHDTRDKGLSRLDKEIKYLQNFLLVLIAVILSCYIFRVIYLAIVI